MGFRNGAFATVWEIQPISQTFTKARISISHKDKTTGAYVEDFKNFVGFFGTAAASKASRLQPRDRIRLGDVDVRNKWDADKRVMYYDFAVYSFDPADSYSPSQSGMYGDTTGMLFGDGFPEQAPPVSPVKDHPEVGDGEPDPFDEDSLPF